MVSMRLAPGDDPAAAQDALAAHLTAHVPWGAHVTVTPGAAAAPYELKAVGDVYDLAIDPKTGWTNVGVRRLMLRGRREAGIDLVSPSDLRAIYEASAAAGTPLPVSFVVGAHPTDHIAAVMRLPGDELGLVASLRDAPLAVVRCVTNDIRVPADAEWVLEGYLDARGHVVLVRQYRHAASGFLLEAPAGKLDAGETPEACARRELQEETGFYARDLVSLGFVWASPGFTDERLHLFLAQGIAPRQQALEADEVLTVETLPLAEAVKLAEHGDITDGKTVCALLRARAYLER